MDLEALRIFSIVAREGSIQGAANAGAGSRTTVRHKLDALEKAIGVPLLHRGPSGVELTEAGEVLARRVGEMLADVETLLHTTREVALNPRRAIRISVPTGPPPVAIENTLRFIRQLWSDARIEIQVRDDEPFLDPRETDICATLAPEIADGPYLVYEVATIDAVLIASPDYIAAHGPIATLEDLEGHPICQWLHPALPDDDTLPLRDGGRLPITSALTTNDAHIVHELVEAGSGLGFVSHVNLAPDDEERFVTLLPDVVGTSFTVRLLISTAVADSPRIKTLTEIIEGLFGSTR